MSLPRCTQKGTRALKTVFCTVVGLFATMAIMIGIGNEIKLPRGVFISFLFGGGTALLILGIVLIILTLKSSIGGKLKKFLILTGASVAGFFVSVVLHNLIYGLFIYFFGKDFWGPEGDEPVFFILAIVVCPIGFLIGAIGSGVLLVKNRKYLS